MGTIFFFSNDKADASSKKSDGLIINVCEKMMGRSLNNREKKHYLTIYVTPIRKCAHFTIYLLLGLIFISLLKEYNITDKRSIVYTVLFVCIYACGDEIHQLFVSGRSGEILDVFIDTCGGFTGSMIYKLFTRRKV